MPEPVHTSPIPFSERLLGAVLYAPIRMSQALPYRWRIPVAGWLTSRVLAPVAGYHRRVRENLRLVCPGLSEAEMTRIARGVADNFGRGMAELYSPEFPERAARATATGPGLETIRAARAAGRPVVIVSGHFGNVNAARVKLRSLGIDNAGFYKALRNRPFNARYAEAMRRISEPLFERNRAGVAQMLRTLKQGGAQSMLNDLNAHDGLPLEFFGQPALTSLSAAEMALRYDAPMMPIWGIRAENGLDFEIVFEEEIPPSDPLTMTREYNARLEAQVRAHMDQWFWIHRRWKDGANWVGEMRGKELAELEERLAGEG
ncbi:MAG: lysophospholipid acyltransferase family protein [Roseovarius sp.]